MNTGAARPEPAAPSAERGHSSAARGGGAKSELDEGAHGVGGGNVQLYACHGPDLRARPAPDTGPMPHRDPAPAEPYCARRARALAGVDGAACARGAGPPPRRATALGRDWGPAATYRGGYLPPRRAAGSSAPVVKHLDRGSHAPPVRNASARPAPWQRARSPIGRRKRDRRATAARSPSPDARRHLPAARRSHRIRFVRRARARRTGREPARDRRAARGHRPSGRAHGKTSYLQGGGGGTTERLDASRPRTTMDMLRGSRDRPRRRGHRRRARQLDHENGARSAPTENRCPTTSARRLQADPARRAWRLTRASAATGSRAGGRGAAAARRK